ncbi:MAG TPA: MlaD family protein [Tepidisphaeraceae bacterium]|nr:MlaD family protein [Tepidisphaeraceae bacterium]
MVGVVVLGGLLILAWMLIQFGAGFATPFAPASQSVRFVADRADGLSNGSPVTYRGVQVGRVENVSRADDQLQVYIDTALDVKPPLPENLKAIIRSQGLIGGSSLLVLELVGDKPNGTLHAGETIPAHFIGLDILPPEFAELAAEMRLTVKQIRQSDVIGHLDQQIVKAGNLLDSMQSVINDPQMRENLKVSLANIRTTTERATQVTANLEKLTTDLDTLSLNTGDAIAKTQHEVVDLSREMTARLEQTSRLLDQFQSISEKINKGQGTAGALVNDNRLYESLVDSARELNATVSDLHRLVQQWEQDGVSLKMK